MKTLKKLLAVFVLAMAVIMPSFNMMAQYGGNPGIVLAGSSNINNLPEKAKNFMHKHFRNVAVANCEKYFAKEKYEVELANGIDIEFNLRGEITEIDAPNNTVLSQDVVKDILPGKAYKRLEKDGLTNSVESIEFKKGRAYEVDLKLMGLDTYIFNPEGVFIAIQD